MNPRYIIASLAVWVFMFGYEWLLHGVILEPFYLETPDLWRTCAAMGNHFHWLVLGQMIFAFLFSYIFTKGYENRGIAEGARYGWWIGLLLAAPNLIMYAVQPLPALLVMGWSVGGLIEGTLGGMVLAAIYRPVRNA